MPDDVPSDRSTTSGRWWWGDDALLALTFLTRLPLRLRMAPPDAAMPRSMAWYPLVGALVGLAGGAACALAGAVGLPTATAALLAVATMVLLTGGMHEDGLADVADGFGGGRDRARKMEILRDSRIGAYGVLALGLTLGLRVSLLEPAGALAALAAAGALSRATLPALCRALPLARRDGLAVYQGRPSPVVAALAAGAGIAVAALALGPAALVAVVAAASAAVGMGVLARRQIGGYTGDVLGATQQAADIAVLLAVAVMR